MADQDLAIIAVTKVSTGVKVIPHCYLQTWLEPLQGEAVGFILRRDLVLKRKSRLNPGVRYFRATSA